RSAGRESAESPWRAVIPPSAPRNRLTTIAFGFTLTMPREGKPRSLQRRRGKLSRGASRPAPSSSVLVLSGSAHGDHTTPEHFSVRSALDRFRSPLDVRERVQRLFALLDLDRGLLFDGGDV